MHLSVRRATPDDGTILVRFLDGAYGQGYSPTFDRDGPFQPGDIWWAQSEKDVGIIDVDRKPAGALVIGRGRQQWLVEEALLEGYGDAPARAQEALVSRTAAHLVQQFRRGGQLALVLRAAETNAFGLALAVHLRATFANALLAFRHRGPKRPAANPPDGYEVRRAAPGDARELGRLVREVIEDRARGGEIERMLASREGRGFVAARAQILAGFAVVEVRPGRSEWVVGVRETHRRRGVGRALAAAALASLHARGVSPCATAWGADASSGGFLRALGFEVERTFVYVERLL